MLRLEFAPSCAGFVYRSGDPVTAIAVYVFNAPFPIQNGHSALWFNRDQGGHGLSGGKLEDVSRLVPAAFLHKVIKADYSFLSPPKLCECIELSCIR